MSFLTQGRGHILPVGARWVTDGLWQRDPTPAIVGDEIDKAIGASTVVDWRIVSAAEIPPDRYFRDALVDDGKAFSYDISKCKTIKLAKLRTERRREFPELDALWMRAIGQGNLELAAEVEAKRQALRDIPADPRIDAAVSVEELKAVELPE